MGEEKKIYFNINDNEDFPPIQRGYFSGYGMLNGKPCLIEDHPGCKLWPYGCKNCAQYGCSTRGFGRDGKCVKCRFPERNRSKIQQLNFDLMVIWIKIKWNRDDQKLCADLKKEWKSIWEKIKAHNREIDADNAWKTSQ